MAEGETKMSAAVRAELTRYARDVIQTLPADSKRALLDAIAKDTGGVEAHVSKECVVLPAGFPEGPALVIPLEVYHDE